MYTYDLESIVSLCSLTMMALWSAEIHNIAVKHLTPILAQTLSFLEYEIRGCDSIIIRRMNAESRASFFTVLLGVPVCTSIWKIMVCFHRGNLPIYQSTYLRLHSTVTHLLKNIDYWYNGLDLGRLVGLVFIDLKKAFDTVYHEILYQNLVHYGVQQRGRACFRS